MKPFVLIFFLCLIACNSSRNPSGGIIPDKVVEMGNSDLGRINGIWKYKGKNYSGYILEKKDSKVISRLPIYIGRENGVAFGYYANGKIRFQVGFLQGNREGFNLGWYENGKPSYIYFFHNDKFEGEQLSFYPSGNKWQNLHYKAGYEDGKQRSWNDNARLVNNFTVKNGKLYGVIGRYDCMSVIKN